MQFRPHLPYEGHQRLRASIEFLMKTTRRPLLLVGFLVLLAATIWLVRWRPAPTLQAPSHQPGLVLERVSETRWRIGRGLRDRYLNEQGRLNREFRLKPRMAGKGDAITELTVGTVAVDSPMARAGFRVNDRILEVNGRPVTTLARALSLLHEVEAASILRVKVERDRQVIDY